MGKGKQTKEQQASIQSDAVEMDSWIPSDGITMVGTSAYTSCLLYTSPSPRD